MCCRDHLCGAGESNPVLQAGKASTLAAKLHSQSACGTSSLCADGGEAAVYGPSYDLLRLYRLN